MGETSICFLPGADETKSCVELAGDSTKAKTSCNDQAALKSRMVRTQRSKFTSTTVFFNFERVGEY